MGERGFGLHRARRAQEPERAADAVAQRGAALLEQARAQRLVEGEVDVHLLVARAIERAHGGLGIAAGGLHEAREQHELRLLVVGAQDLAPHAVVGTEHAGHEFLAGIGVGGGNVRVLEPAAAGVRHLGACVRQRDLGVLAASRHGHAAAAAQHLQQVEAEHELHEEIDDDQEDDGLDAKGNKIHRLDLEGHPIIKNVERYELPYLKTEVISIINYLNDPSA